ncbi:hypothetical protein BN1723_015490, partial [Verticillium longisporum]
SKKTAKTATQDDAKSPEAFLETYAIMGCLICYSNSCEHGDYGENNEKRNFSLDCNGQLEQLLTKSRDAHEKNDADQTVIEPCSRECFILHGDGSSLGQAMAAREARSWSASNEALLKSLFSSIECSGRVRSKPQCMAAEILNRACWDVHRQLKKLDIQLPEDTSPELPRVKNLAWYDRHKKVLLGDWQEHTDTHDHRLRYVNDPCHHDGPCTAANGCNCVKHDPVPVEVGNNDMIKIKVKHHGRSKKEQRTFHFMPICIKTERLRVPKYREACQEGTA